MLFFFLIDFYFFAQIDSLNHNARMGKNTRVHNR